MTASPILRVLSTLKKQKVKSLLIGGQACILYGAAEFSRDSDFVVLAEPANLEALKKALKALKAVPVYFPDLSIEYLAKGHASHFRCRARGVEGLRVDVMGRLKGCEPFNRLWTRRSRVRVSGAGNIDVISLADLVESKKTQRDKDWLMLTRLVENDVFLKDGRGIPSKVSWWLNQGRVAGTLVRLCADYPVLARKVAARRPLLLEALKGDLKRVAALLKKEEAAERAADVKYWTPLKKELEEMRLGRKR